MIGMLVALLVLRMTSDWRFAVALGLSYLVAYG